MAKQNYRCAGCGIRTDPGMAHHNDLRTLSFPMPVLGDGGGERTGEGREEGPGAGGKGITSGSNTTRTIFWRNWLIAARLLETGSH